MSFIIRTGTLGELMQVNLKIPEFDREVTQDKFKARLDGKDYLILVACSSSEPIAYKVGYAVSPTEFYSWMGGVAPDYRKKGVATKLRKAQELWAANNHYCSISVKSMNRYPDMLQLLISSGYKICGYEDQGSENNSKIRFVKSLVSKV
ncbi:GNAT family N-acetyltransferase [Alteromonas sp. CI.11.F.A3]|uniref:GNAT family N-acetyltransferase n=1 Tax=unclassified Alteromonas TaxID=2614992 RepID=UPI001B3A0485|nr:MULTISPECIES: GNAT family N-acetyltransferase [unclassified Alteromonas]MBQ4829993.1 GNAT family N-acetyltransferase [Alteromonas sp. MMG017]WOI35680.1 GNAT family N-acetyltransferase [Alteromonas sp. CI.11.F.A3]